VYKTLGLWLINWASVAVVDGSPVFASDFAPWLFRNLSPPPRNPSSNTYPLPATRYDLPPVLLLTICWQNHRLHHRCAMFILIPHPLHGGETTKNALTLYNVREPNETWTYKHIYYYFYFSYEYYVHFFVPFSDNTDDGNNKNNNMIFTLYIIYYSE